PPALELLTDRPRPAVQSFHGATQTFILPEALSAALKALSRSEGVTLFTTLLAGLQTLFYRYTGQADFMIGSPIANRNHLETEKLIGCFTNTLVLRADLSGNPRFRELLQRVWEATLGAHTHQDVPFEKLVEELQPERDLSRAPLFQVMFVLQNASTDSWMNLPGLDIDLLATDSGTARFDLTLSMSDTASGLVGTLEYNTDLFDAATIARLLTHYSQLLTAACAAPDQPLASLPLLAAAERRQLLTAWNQTQVAYPPHLLLHQLFERQAALTPETIALTFGEQHLSYRELNQQANQLAQHLRALGVCAEARVGVMLARTPQMVVALLGILKAGGAYVPLDPSYPPERLSFMLDDAEVKVLLTTSEFAPTLPQRQLQTLCLDRDWSQLATLSTAHPTSTALPANLAYVIYTSGSTGRPKGVAITHQSAVTFLHWSTQFFSPTDLAAVLAATSINFDLSIFELFAPLAVGGRVILAANALQLPTLAAANEVHLVNTVPSAMAELVRQGAVPASVRTINLAGEALSRK